MLLHLRTCCKPGTRIHMHPALHHGRGNSRYLLQTSLRLVSDSDRRLCCVFFPLQNRTLRLPPLRSVPPVRGIKQGKLVVQTWPVFPRVGHTLWGHCHGLIKQPQAFQNQFLTPDPCLDRVNCRRRPLESAVLGILPLSKHPGGWGNAAWARRSRIRIRGYIRRESFYHVYILRWTDSTLFTIYRMSTQDRPFETHGPRITASSHLQAATGVETAWVSYHLFLLHTYP